MALCKQIHIGKTSLEPYRYSRNKWIRVCYVRHYLTKVNALKSLIRYT